MKRRSTTGWTPCSGDLTRLVDANGNATTWDHDDQGRKITETRANGAAYRYTYDTATGRLKTTTDPKGNVKTSTPTTSSGASGRDRSAPQPIRRPSSSTAKAASPRSRTRSSWSYYDNLGDHRLQEIHNKRPDGSTLSKFNYTYDGVGNILTWRQQADSDPAKLYELGYDTADQLTAAILKTTDPSPVILKRYYYAYDPAGNRLAEQIDDATTGASYNNMNQLVSQQAGGTLVFKGTVSEPAPWAACRGSSSGEGTCRDIAVTFLRVRLRRDG